MFWLVQRVANWGGQHGMAGRRGRQSGSGGLVLSSARSVCASLTSLTAALLAGASRPALAADGESLTLTSRMHELTGSLPAFNPHNAVYLSAFMGLVAFSTTTALIFLRERRRWTARERSLLAEVGRLRAASDRAELLIGSDRQLVGSWAGRDGEGRFEGDPSIAGDGATVKRVLAFGSWLIPGDAAALEASLDTLKERGEGFRLTARSQTQTFIDVEGRTIGGRAILRLRDITGDRAELMRARSELAAARTDLRSMTTLLDTIAHPLWIRDAKDQLLWANTAYLHAVDAGSIEDAVARSLELFDGQTREESARRRANGVPFDERVATVVAGQRRMLDVAERPTSGGSAGIAIDVSERESIRTDLNRQMDAHVRTLDQLPTAVAIFDASQRLVYHNAAYQRLWKLDSAFLATPPTDSELLDRLRASRKLPEQADFRTWKADVLSGYQAVEPRETWWHLPDRRTLRVVMNPNPKGGVTYLFDDVSEHILLESQVTALTRVQSETLDTLKEGVAVFGSNGRLKLTNRAFLDMWQLPSDIVEEQPHIDAIIKACRLLAPQDEPWVDIRGAVAGLP